MPISIPKPGPKLGPYLANLRHLRAFLAVCEFGGIDRAAHHLARPKSAVVQSVQGLECGLGTPLFERRPYAMLCNAQGGIVRRHAERALRAFGAGLDAVSGTAGVLGASLAYPDSLFHEARLQAFTALAGTGDARSAAATIGVTPLAIARAINDLERSLDTPLFTRTGAGRVPTAAGWRFAPFVHSALSELRLIQTEIEQQAVVPAQAGIHAALPQPARLNFAPGC